MVRLVASNDIVRRRKGEGGSSNKHLGLSWGLVGFDIRFWYWLVCDGLVDTGDWCYLVLLCACLV